MTNFIEKLIDNQLPVEGFKSYFTPRELLREERDAKTLSASFRPILRGFAERRYKHGSNLQNTGQTLSLDITDKIKLHDKFYLKNQLTFQHGSHLGFRAHLGVDLGNLGELEVIQQARNTEIADSIQIRHYNSRNGLNTLAVLQFDRPSYQANLHLSSVYNHVYEIFDRRVNKLKKVRSIYGINTSFGFDPLQQTSYSLYYQSKFDNYNFIAAYVRKLLGGDKFYTNNVIGGFKCKTADNRKFVAKVTYNIEDRVPQLDLMIRNTHNTDKSLKTFHRISSTLKAGSGLSWTFGKAKLSGLIEANLVKSSYNTHPFNFAFKIGTDDANHQTANIIPKK